MSQYGYWVDLDTVQLGDATDRKLWLQAFPFGSFKHPLYGKINFTPDRAARFAANVKDRVRGQDLDIDYDHKERTGKAAGWVQDAEARESGLWIQVEFTEDGFDSIRKKEYRYFSPEFVDEWKHPSTGAMHKDVLFGGALTNRPFLKDMIPVNMSEVSDEGGNEVDEFLEKLRKALKLSEDATEEEILAAAAEAEAGPEDEETEEESEESEEGEEDESTELSEDDIAALIAQNPKLKKLTDRITALETTSKLSEIKVQLTEWSSETSGKKFGLPAAVHDDLRKLMLSEGSAAVKAVIDKVLETGLVEFGERGGQRHGARKAGQGGSPTEQYNDRVQTIMQEKKLSYLEAAAQLSETDPDLYEAYRVETLEGAGEVAN